MPTTTKTATVEEINRRIAARMLERPVFAGRIATAVPGFELARWEGASELREFYTPFIGYTVQGGVEAIQYYGGEVAGVCAIFASTKECFGYPISAVFTTEGILDDYESKPSHECALCKAGKKVDAIVNTYGISYFK